MAEFTLEHLTNFIFSGYKYILYIKHEESATVLPLMELMDERDVESMDGYQIGITEPEVIEMAKSVDDYKFYVELDFIND